MTVSTGYAAPDETPSNGSPTASFDLHLHSYWSTDGSASVEDYFAAAENGGMRCISLTEHDNLDSISEARAVSEHYPSVRFLPGTEITVRTSIWPWTDLVCLGFPLEDTPEVTRLRMYLKNRAQMHTSSYLAGLESLGFAYSEREQQTLAKTYRPTDIVDRQGGGPVRWSVEADYFVKKGLIKSVEEYQELRRRVRVSGGELGCPDAAELVPLVKATGALVFIAHPYEYFLGFNQERISIFCEECQLDGIECASRRISPQYSRHYRKYCVKHGLLSSAGSDTHSAEDIGKYFGAHCGADSWLDDILSRLSG